MVEAGWEPTVDSYLNRVPKAQILEAVREAKGEGTAQLLDHLKKGQMATEAARLLKGCGWLLEVLRRHDLAGLDGEEGQGASENVSDRHRHTSPADWIIMSHLAGTVALFIPVADSFRNMR